MGNTKVILKSENLPNLWSNLKNNFLQLIDYQTICYYLNAIENSKKIYGMQEVIGSTPIFSTKSNRLFWAIFLFMEYCCYILYSAKLDRYYIGHTEDLEQRLVQHNSGLSTFTAKANDWIIVYQQFFDTREEARKRENEIKKKKSRKYIEWISSAD